MELRIHPALQRAQLLVEHRRYAEAERELRHVLTEIPEHVMALLMLAETMLEQEKVEEAKRVAQQALGIQPDSPYTHYTYSRVLYKQEKYKEAMIAVRDAIMLDPSNPNYHGLLATMLMDERKFEESLAAAERGLSFDPEHVLCLNIRSRLLFKLNRKQEAVQTIDKALEQDPDNASTHANYGWAWLEKGNPQQAMEHFRASLQLDPTLDFAKEGMKEALKARYWVYRQYLRYAFWIANQSSKRQWIFIIGLYIMFRFVSSVADSNPELAPFLTPLLFIYIAFAVSSWLMEPLGNLFLMLNPYGRYVLNEKERKAARIVGVSLGISLLSFLLMAITDLDLYFVLGFVAFTMMVPFGSMERPSRPKDVQFLRICALIMLAIGLGATVLEAVGSGIAYTVFIAYIGAFLVYQFVANAKLTR